MRVKDLLVALNGADPESPVVLKGEIMATRSIPILSARRLNLQQYDDPDQRDFSLVFFFDASAAPIPDDPAARR